MKHCWKLVVHKDIQLEMLKCQSLPPPPPSPLPTSELHVCQCLFVLQIGLIMEILIIQLSFASSLFFHFFLSHYIFLNLCFFCVCVCVFKFKIVHGVRSDAKYRNKWWKPWFSWILTLLSQYWAYHHTSPSTDNSGVPGLSVWEPCPGYSYRHEFLCRGFARGQLHFISSC